MTTRERLTRKLDKREEWAKKAAAGDRIASGIPMGQPILVGHHSEGHARRDAERIASHMQHGVEETRLAEHHESKADGLARQLEHNIYSDDADALAALETRIADREAQATIWTDLNKAWRKAKGDPATFATLAGISEAEAQATANGIAAAYSWEKQPIPSWQLSNLRANIRRDRERIEEIKTRAARSEQAEQAGGVTVEMASHGYCRITFAEQPDRAILDALKAAGFRWAAGSWLGYHASLPEDVRALIT